MVPYVTHSLDKNNFRYSQEPDKCGHLLDTLNERVPADETNYGTNSAMSTQPVSAAAQPISKPSYLWSSLAETLSLERWQRLSLKLVKMVINFFSDLVKTCSPCLFCPVTSSSWPYCLSSRSCCSLLPGEDQADGDDENDDRNAYKRNHVDYSGGVAFFLTSIIEFIARYLFSPIFLHVTQ